MSESVKHPRGIYTLFFTEMWERMSYYGMRALLTLFMVDQVQGMKLTDAQATAIYGLYTALVYVTALPGGWVGDRLLGMKRAVWWGGIVIALGHITLGVERVEAFYLGLVIIAVGSGLLKSNMSSLVAQLYPEGGVRRDAGYTLFYMGVNVGAFIGMILCPWLAQKYGWRWGFSAAAAGMVLGLVQFHFTKNHIAHIGECPAHSSASRRRDWLVLIIGLALISALMALCLSGIIIIDPLSLAKNTATIIICIATAFFAWAFFLAGLTQEEKKRMALILVLFGASALFFAGFEQAGSSFSLFAERHTIRTVGSLGEIPAGQFQSLNSLMVIGLAPLIAMLWGWLARRNAEPRTITKFAWGLLALALGFIVAAYAAQRALASGPVLPTWLITIYLLHTLGELFLSPIGLSAVSKLAPQRLAGMMMGIWFLGSALGNILAGLLAGEVTGEASAQMPHVFMQVVYLSGASGIVLIILSKPLSKLMKGIHLLPFLFFLSFLSSTASSADKPNVVYIMADDIGWGDISAHGGGVPTPNIDRLFSKGVELTQFMGWCVCSPTRAMLLTGRHPIRVGTGPEVGGELDPAETTIAEGFKANGYRTGVFGKWHSGNDPQTPKFSAHFTEAFKHMPNKKPDFGHGVNAHGFDEAWVYYGGGPDHFTRHTVKGAGPVSWWHNREFRPQDKGYTDDLLTQHALEFIRASNTQPFFCYIPFQIAHAPIQAKESDLAKIDPKMAAKLPTASGKTTDENKHIHAAMLHALDNNVATIEAELTKLGLLENTILVFTSDNGAMEAGSSLPLRGHKHTVYDGGVRLPTMIHWPKGGLVGGKKWNGLCGALDMFPTLMAMTESKMPETRPLDGKNIWPALRDNTASLVESYYWIWKDEDAIRTAQWKLHRFFNRYELYDIAKDELEANNVAESNPDVIKSLASKMDVWADSLGAALSHQPAPAKYHQSAAPEGEVLAVTVTITDQAKPKDKLAISLVNWNGTQYATDWIEYDIAFSPNKAKRQPYFSMLEGDNSKPFGPLFKTGTGVDQHARDQLTGPGIADGKGTWEHRIIGLASSAPGPLGKHGVVFTGGTAGTYTIYLDNLRLRHTDGSTTPIWSSGKDTRKGAVKESDLFKDVNVTAVDVMEVGK